MFEVRVTKQPQRYLEKVTDKMKEALGMCFEKLEHNPFLVAEPLHGQLKGKWRARVGNLRIIMEINIDIKVIKVFYIGPRGDIYK